MSSFSVRNSLILCGVILSLYIPLCESQTCAGRPCGPALRTPAPFIRTCRGKPCGFFFDANRITTPQQRQRGFFDPSLFNNPVFANNPLFRPRTNLQNIFRSTPQPPTQGGPVTSGGLVPTSATVTAITQELQSMIAANPRLVALYVELAFHACVGGCDGCLDLNHANNKGSCDPAGYFVSSVNIMRDVKIQGIREPYTALRVIHRRFAGRITHADLVFLAAAEGANKGLERAGKQQKVTPRFGRQSCANPDNPVKAQNFPGGDDPKAPDQLMQMFRMTRKEVLALMGAHSLGQCHIENLGFKGAWDNSPEALDNGYYKSLVGTNWVAAQTPSGAFQWVLMASDADRNFDFVQNNPGRMMLSADMIWRSNFTNGASGRPSCMEATNVQSTSCPLSRDMGMAVEYSLDRNSDLFTNDFIAVYEKMIQFGHSGLRTPS